MRDNAIRSPYDVYTSGAAQATKEALLLPEWRWRRAWYPTPLGDGIFLMEPLGAQNRNAVAGSAVVTVAASAVLGTTYTDALALDLEQDIASRYVLFVWNASDAAVTVTLQNAVTVGAGTVYATVSDADVIAVVAGAGVCQLTTNGFGLGDAAGQVIVKLTSAASVGGDVTVQIRYL